MPSPLSDDLVGLIVDHVQQTSENRSEYLPDILSLCHSSSCFVITANRSFSEPWIPTSNSRQGTFPSGCTNYVKQSLSGHGSKSKRLRIQIALSKVNQPRVNGVKVIN